MPKPSVKLKDRPDLPDEVRRVVSVHRVATKNRWTHDDALVICEYYGFVPSEPLPARSVYPWAGVCRGGHRVAPTLHQLIQGTGPCETCGRIEGGEEKNRKVFEKARAYANAIGAVITDEIIDRRVNGDKLLRVSIVWGKCGHKTEAMAVGNLLKGRGCASCAKSGFATQEPGTFYIVSGTSAHTGRPLVKVGIAQTRRRNGLEGDCPIDIRLGKHRRRGLDRVLVRAEFERGRDAAELERKWKRWRLEQHPESLASRSDLPDGFSEAVIDSPEVRAWIDSWMEEIGIEPVGEWP